MAEWSLIAWCHHTHNEWHGCTHEGPECDSCYAEAWGKRTGVGWGNESRRKFLSEKHSKEPLKWNARCEREGVRERVFCGSMKDVAELLPPSHPDYQMMDTIRGRLWERIEETPYLDWLLLSKRPQNYRRVLPARWIGEAPRNVWLGTTAGNQDGADRRGRGLEAAGSTFSPSVLFFSCEPLLGPVTIPDIALGWLIIGGESHANPRKAREFNAAWAKSLIDQCRERGIAPFFKQFGSNPVDENGFPMRFNHRKGEDPSEWPEWARVQEFPEALTNAA